MVPAGGASGVGRPTSRPSRTGRLFSRLPQTLRVESRVFLFQRKDLGLLRTGPRP